jgi:hypothetical protein
MKPAILYRPSRAPFIRVSCPGPTLNAILLKPFRARISVSRPKLAYAQSPPEFNDIWHAGRRIRPIGKIGLTRPIGPIVFVD